MEFYTLHKNGDLSKGIELHSGDQGDKYILVGKSHYPEATCRIYLKRHVAFKKEFRRENGKHCDFIMAGQIKKGREGFLLVIPEEPNINLNSSRKLILIKNEDCKPELFPNDGSTFLVNGNHKMQSLVIITSNCKVFLNEEEIDFYKIGLD